MIRHNDNEKKKLYKYLINEKDKVKILGADFTITDIEFDEIRQKQLMSIHNHHDDNGDDKDYVYKDILLTFENEFDKDEESGLLSFVYQEYFEMSKN